MTRLLTAAVAVPPLVLVIMRGRAELFLALVLVMAILGFRELEKLMHSAPLRVGYPVVALFVLTPHPSFPPLEHVVFLVVVVLGIVAVSSLEPGRDAVARILATVFGVLYIGAPLASVAALRLRSLDSEARLWIVFLLAVIMVGDAGAYYVGSALGKHALAPKLSPKKTVEGLVGGVAASVAAASTVRALWMPFVPATHAIFLGLVLALVGVVGDLFESLLKRSAGMKDTSSLFPGHGGILDRLDSVLFAGPVLFLYVEWTRMS